MTRNGEKKQIDLDERSVNREQADCQEETLPRKESHLVSQEWKQEYTWVSPPYQILQAVHVTNSIFCLLVKANTFLAALPVCNACQWDQQNTRVTETFEDSSSILKNTSFLTPKYRKQSLTWKKKGKRKRTVLHKCINGLSCRIL